MWLGTELFYIKAKLSTPCKPELTVIDEVFTCMGVYFNCNDN